MVTSTNWNRGPPYRTQCTESESRLQGLPKRASELNLRSTAYLEVTLTEDEPKWMYLTAGGEGGGGRGRGIHGGEARWCACKETVNRLLSHGLTPQMCRHRVSNK